MIGNGADSTYIVSTFSFCPTFAIGKSNKVSCWSEGSESWLHFKGCKLFETTKCTKKVHSVNYIVSSTASSLPDFKPELNCDEKERAYFLKLNPKKYWGSYVNILQVSKPCCQQIKWQKSKLCILAEIKCGQCWNWKS